MNKTEVLALLKPNNNERGIKNWKKSKAHLENLESLGIGVTQLRKIEKLSRRIPFLLLAISVLLFGTANGCATRPRPSTDLYGVYANDEPPNRYLEVIPVAPNPAWVWIDGHWYWNGERYVWLRGHWAPAPEPGHDWVRAGWVQDGGRYRFVSGRWVHRSHPMSIRYHRHYHTPVQGKKYATQRHGGRRR